MAVELDVARYAELFLVEGREHLAELDAALAELESAISGGAPVEGALEVPVASAFRAAHSIKGMAAAMGYDSVQASAHALESALDSIRRRDTKLTPTALVHIFDMCDRLASHVDEVAASARPRAAGADEVFTTAPARYVRVDARRLDSLLDLASELEVARRRLEREIAPEWDESARDAFGAVARLVTAVRDEVVTARMVPVGQVFERFPRLVRDTARELSKDVEFTLAGAEIELDRSTLDQIGDPVVHLIRNAIDHGIETPAERERAGKPPRGSLSVTVERDGSDVVVRVADDGRGIDKERVLERARAAGLVGADVRSLRDGELVTLLTRSGFSTAERVTRVSGRGVGLDVVDCAVRRLGGAIDLRSVPGRGTTVLVRLPVTLAIVRALLARVGAHVVAIPFTHVTGVTPPGEPAALPDPDAAPSARAIPLRDLFGVAGDAGGRERVVAVAAGGRDTALVVDEVLGHRDVVVKRIDMPRDARPMFSGATILDDGAPALIVDVHGFL